MLQETRAVQVGCLTTSSSHPPPPPPLNVSSALPIPKEARAVIAGGGVIGCAVAYYLAKAGWRDILLLEQGRYSNIFQNVKHQKDVMIM